MPPQLTGSMLVGMATVRLIDAVALQQAAQQGDTGIDYEHPQQNQPGPEQLLGNPSGLQ